MFTPKKPSTSSAELQKLDDLLVKLIISIESIAQLKIYVTKDKNINSIANQTVEGTLFDIDETIKSLSNIEKFLVHKEVLLQQLNSPAENKDFASALAAEVNPGFNDKEMIANERKKTLENIFPELIVQARMCFAEYQLGLVNYELEQLKKLNEPKIEEILPNLIQAIEGYSLQSECLNKILKIAITIPDEKEEKTELTEKRVQFLQAIEDMNTKIQKVFQSESLQDSLEKYHTKVLNDSSTEKNKLSRP